MFTCTLILFLIAVTLTTGAKDVLVDSGLNRDDILLAAKLIGRRVVEDSQSSETPLRGMVYDGWGLHDDGVPACRFTRSRRDGELLFSGKFRAEGGVPFVERRRTVSPDGLRTLVSGSSSPTA